MFYIDLNALIFTLKNLHTFSFAHYLLPYLTHNHLFFFSFEILGFCFEIVVLGRSEGHIMASSDDEAEIEPESVSNYHFVDERDEPISFSVLPIQWNEHESTGGDKRHIFLHGFADNGLQKIHKHAIAWKFDLTNVIPDMLVLSKEKHWIKLQKPRKSFEEICRTILITVHCLSYAKRNPEATGKSVWDYLSRVFRYISNLCKFLGFISFAPILDCFYGFIWFVVHMR